MDDRVPLHPASGAAIRGSVGEAAYVCRRCPVLDDDRRRLFTAGIAVFLESDVPNVFAGSWPTSTPRVVRLPWNAFARITAPNLSNRSSWRCSTTTAFGASTRPLAPLNMMAWSSAGLLSHWGLRWRHAWSPPACSEMLGRRRRSPSELRLASMRETSST